MSRPTMAGEERGGEGRRRRRGRRRFSGGEKLNVRLTEFGFGVLWKKLKQCPVDRTQARIYATVFFAMFLNAFVITMLFPFLPFMVQFLLPNVEETSIGKYAGIIASALFIGRVFGSYFWGAIADRKGRKPVLIVSSILIGFFSTVFGFSVNFPMAVLMRFLLGVCNGVVGTSKAVISEISDDKTQAIGLSIVITAFGMGLVIGPAVSGAIADPIGQYNLTINNTAINTFLTKFPYSLPCIVSGMISIVASLVLFFCLPETLGTKKRDHQQLPQEDSETSQTSELANDLEEPEAPDEAITGEVDLGTLSGRLLEEEGEEEGEGEVTEMKGARNSWGAQQPGGARVQVLSRRDDDETDMTAICLDKDEEEEREDEEEGEEIKLVSDVEEKSAEGGRERDKRRRSSSVLVAFLSRRGSVVPSFLKVSKKKYQSWTVNGVTKEEKEEEEGEKEEEETTNGNNDDELLVGFEGSQREKRLSLNKVGQSLKKSLLDFKQLITDKLVMLAILSYCTYSFAVIGFDEVFPLWASASRDVGGLDFSLHEIGIIMAVVGVAMLPISLFAFAIMEKVFGAINSFHIFAISALFVVTLLPNLRLLIDHTVPFWALLGLSLLLLRTSTATCFAATSLFCNNSVSFDKLGSVNGLQMSVVAIFRGVAPVFSGGIFAVSLKSTIGFPFDYRLIFIIYGLVHLIAVVFVACLPKSVNKQKVS